MRWFEEGFRRIKSAQRNRQLAQIRVVSITQQVFGVVYRRQVQMLEMVIPESLSAQGPIEQLDAPPVRGRGYIASSLFLRDCYGYLVQGEAEEMYAVTGVRSYNLYTLERMLPLDLECQSESWDRVSGDSIRLALLSLADSGHSLHAVFHSHCGRGIPAPSSVDRELQQGLDGAGCTAIQAVFSDDGFIRFFGGQRPFRIQVYGTGVEKLDARLYRLVNCG